MRFTSTNFRVLPFSVSSAPPALSFQDRSSSSCAIPTHGLTKHDKCVVYCRETHVCTAVVYDDVNTFSPALLARSILFLHHGCKKKNQYNVSYGVVHDVASTFFCTQDVDSYRSHFSFDFDQHRVGGQIYCLPGMYTYICRKELLGPAG